MAVADAGVALRPNEIAGRRFRLVLRGYDPTEVERFLRTVAQLVGRLQGEVEWQRARGAHLEHRGAQIQDRVYERLAGEFAEVLKATDEALARVRERSGAQAAAVLQAARAEAARIVEAARAQAREIVPSGSAHSTG